MKTVIIPSNTYPWWECTINGVKYRYKSGTEQTVPDEVAEIIENGALLEPRTVLPGKPGQVWTLGANGAGFWADLPGGIDIGPGEAGSVLITNRNGKLEWGSVDPAMITPGNEGQFLKINKNGSGNNEAVWDTSRMSPSVRGVANQAASVADATDTTDVVETLNTLLAHMRTSGILKN